MPYRAKERYFLTQETIDRYRKTYTQREGRALEMIEETKKLVGSQDLYANSPIFVGEEDDPEILEALEHMEKKWQR